MKNWILKILKKFIDWLSIQYTKYLPKREIDLPYNSLSPTDNAEKVEYYLETFEWALNNTNKIKNVAVAGPYGSGKSSVIQTFQNRHKHNKNYHFLNISLATFKEEKKKKNGSNCENKDDLLRLIELSILQQLFYHEKDNKIPDSGFKKIKSHTNKYLWLITIGMIVFAVAFLHLVFPNFLAKFSLFELTPQNSKFFHYTSVIIVLLGSLFMVFKLIRILKGLTIKKLGISNASIEIDDKISKSILNNHIDEILYFFEVTNYNTVIIEDLDRFEQTDVFTKLREINLLINNSKKIEKDVVFIYAIRDDMFQDNDRTKFFDFMIPIIPVINSSNSNEKLLNLIQTNNYKISTDLIEDISLFIDDMRLLYNILNEYHIYFKKLNPNLNQDKLLSMITYKNIYPNDFTKLSQNKGKLYKTIINKHKYINEKISVIDNKIISIKDEIKTIESINIRDIKELRLVYISKFIQKINQSGQAFKSFFINNQEFNISQATEDNFFDTLKSLTTIQYVCYSSIGHQSSINYDFNKLEFEVNSNYSYKEREELIINNIHLEELKNSIEKLEKEKNEIKKNRIKDLVSDKNIAIESENQNQKALINVLLRNGYIDEDYLDYISIFYIGSLSKNDHQFLINVKTQKENEFDFPLQKKENLVKRINEFEFEKKYLLNYDLIDFLIKSSKYSAKRKKVITQLSNESETTVRFIDGFIDYTANIEKFIKYLCKDWINIWSFLENKSNYPKEKTEKYFKLIIEHAEVKDIKNIFANSISKISDNKDFLLIIMDTAKLKEIIKELDIEFSVLDESASQELLDYVYDNNNYSLNKKVIRFFLKNKGKLIENDFDTKNYSTIKQSKLDKLVDYIEDNINEYITSIYLEIETNTAETETVYIQLLNNENISYDNKVKIVTQIETIITDVNDIEDIEQIKLLLVVSKILATWNNLVDIYVQNENKFIEEILSFINVADNAKKLSNSKINKEHPDKKTADSFTEALLLSEEIIIESYSIILKSIPFIYNSLNFENLSYKKVELLINNNKLTTNSTNFDLLKDNFDNLNINLIEHNSNKFIENIDSFELENEDLLSLLKSDIINIQIKEKIIKNYDTSTFTIDSKLLTQIGKLLLENSNLDIDNIIVKSIGKDSNLGEFDKIKLHNKWYRIYDNEDTSSFLLSLGEPYSFITENGKRPLLDNNEINRGLAENLKLKGYISKYKIEKKKGIRISTFRNK